MGPVARRITTVVVVMVVAGCSATTTTPSSSSVATVSPSPAGSTLSAAANPAPSESLSTAASPASTAAPFPLLVIARRTSRGPVVSFVYDAAQAATDVATLPGDANGSIASMAWSGAGRLALAGQPTATGLGVYAFDRAAGRLALVSAAADPGCTAVGVRSIGWTRATIVFDVTHDPTRGQCVDGLVRVDPATGVRAHVDAPIDAVHWAVSPDGGAIAHDSLVMTLSISDLATGASRVVGGIQHKTDSAWSPDGTRVLYVDPGTGSAQLVTAPRDPSGTPVDLTSAAVGVAGFDHVGWGADANTVFFRSWKRGCQSGCDGFYRLDISAGTLTKIAPLPDLHQEAWNNNFGYVFDWALSPDGTQVAYDLTPAPGRPTEILVVDAIGRSAPITLSAPGEDARFLGWASPGVVAYQTDAGIVLVKADGSGRSVIPVADVTAVALASGSIAHRW